MLITRDYLELESGIRSAAASLGAIHAVAVISRAVVNAERDFDIYSACFPDSDGNGWEVPTNPPTD